MLLALLGASCGNRAREVVVYVSVDQVYSEPVLKAFEQASGIRVRALYDVEASKTTGLATRLLAERGNPRADLFWSGDFAATLRLKEQNVLAPSAPSAAAGIAAAFADSQHVWYGLGGRARVFLVNRTLLSKDRYPRGLADYLNPAYPADRIGLALPLFGTSANQAAALSAVWGADSASRFYAAVRARGVRIVEGNSVAADLVARGALLFALVDTDDALAEISRGAPVVVVAPDQERLGTLVVPGTVAMVRGSRNSREAAALLSYLLRPETEQELIRVGYSQWSLRGDLKSSPMFPHGLRVMHVSLTEVYAQFPRAMESMREIFSR